MAGPEVIDLKGATFHGPDFEERNSKAAAERRADEANKRAADEAARQRAEFILAHGFPPEEVPSHFEIPGDQSKTGEEYLKSLPPALAGQVRAMSEGRRAFPTGAALRDPQTRLLVAAATQYDPNMDAANVATRVQTRRDFTPGGKMGLNLTALNTAIGHLATLKRLSAKLHNTPIPKVNAIKNSIMSNLGAGDITAFNTARNGFTAELAKVFKGTGAPSMSEIDDWKNAVNLNLSPDQFDAFVRTAHDMLNSRIEAVGDAYNRGMSRSDQPITLLSPHAQQLYAQLESGATEDNSQDAFLAGPEGKQVAGEDVKGFRFAPEEESQLQHYLHTPDFTPQGFAELAAKFAQGHGVKTDDAWKATMADQGKGVAEYIRQHPDYSPSVDYSNVDKAATENASLGESVAQTLRNLPESATSLVGGVTAPATDLVRTIANEGSPQGIYELGYNLLTNPAETGKQVGDVFSDRYGGWDNLKRTIVKDPFGLAGDASMVLTGGGTAAGRLPGVAGRVGAEVANLGRAVDPLAAIHKAVTTGAPRAFNAVPPGVREGAGDVLAETIGFPSGVGGEAVKTAFQTGRDRGLAGAPTAASEAFQANRTEPGRNAGQTVALAQQGVGNLRQQASRDYQRQIQSLGENPEPLPLADVLQTVADLKPPQYDVWVGNPNRPADHTAWERMNDAVHHYAQQAAADPSLLEPMAIDQLKQALYDIGKGSEVGTSSGRIAREARNSVKQLLTDHDPSYASTMENYGNAMDEIEQLNDTFGLGTRAGGKGPNIDSSTRKLQSIFRNNANTNFGQRAAQGERLAELDPTGTLMPSLAGQTMSAWTPRGLRGGVTLAELASAYMLGNTPAATPFLPLSIPRLTGKLVHAAGRGVGTAERVAVPAAKQLDELYRKYPGRTLALQRAQATQDQIDADEARSLAEKYGIVVPGAVDFGMGR